MAIAAQIAANRANARRSTGPRSPEGKAASSRNALTHGAHASDDTILATAPDTYLEAFRAHFQPVGVLEAHLVDHLAVLASRRERLNAALDALIELNERHALTEHLHERYGINTPNGEALGQPSWQAALRRYDGNPGADPRRPGLDSDPALDPDPVLCSLAYTLSGPRAAALFRHEASVDRRFSATLKQLTTLQTQRHAAAAMAGKTPPIAATAPVTPPAAATAGETRPTTPPHEPSFLRAVERYLRATATPADPWFEPIPAAVPVPPAGSLSAAADPAPTPLADNEAPGADQTQSAATEHARTSQNAQNEPNAAVTPPHRTAMATSIPVGATPTHVAPVAAAAHDSAATSPIRPDQQNEATTPYDPAHDETGGFLSDLPRYPDRPSRIPAHR